MCQAYMQYTHMDTYIINTHARACMHAHIMFTCTCMHAYLPAHMKAARSMGEMETAMKSSLVRRVWVTGVVEESRRMMRRRWRKPRRRNHASSVAAW